MNNILISSYIFMQPPYHPMKAPPTTSPKKQIPSNMRKPNFKKIFRDPYVIASVITGVVLLTLTLIFRVNPVEVSVVNDAIAGTPFHFFLLCMTMPAWIAGIVIGLTTFISFPLMFLFQIIIFTFVGLLLRLIHKTIARFLHRHR